MKFRKSLKGARVGGLLLAMVFFCAAQERAAQPPEAAEYIAAMRIEDPEARIEKLESIIAKYPESPYRGSMEFAITNARIELCRTVEDILELQEAALEGMEGLGRLSFLSRMAAQILDHENLEMFDKAETINAVLGYIGEGEDLANQASFFEQIPEDQKRYFPNVLSGLKLTKARAYACDEDFKKVFSALEEYDETGGQKVGGYHYLRAKALAGTGRPAEALDAYLGAAVDSPRGFLRDAVDKARALYIETTGSEAGFLARLNQKLKELPFHPEVFEPDREWKGKTVLLELFTGSECPPCVAVDLAFDGILEAYDPKYVAILEYHLPIPGPDPMMNPATGLRQDVYDVRSAPTVVIDGDNDREYVGGGSRGMAGAKFGFYAAEIAARLYEEPVLIIEAEADRNAEVVKVEFSTGPLPSRAELHVALVQREERYRGSNGLVFHKMVVRDLITASRGAGEVRFLLDASESAADRYLTEFEKTYSQSPNFRFAERKAKIDRDDLLIVVFVQDKETRQVLNAAVADVH